MIRDNYSIVKAKVSAGCKHYVSYYELNVWFENSDLKSSGSIYNVPMFTMKEQAGVQRGYGFKKIQIYLNSIEGKKWLSKYLEEQDTNEKIDKLKDSIRLSIYKMNLSQLEEFNKIGQQMVKRKN